MDRGTDGAGRQMHDHVDLGNHKMMTFGSPAVALRASNNTRDLVDQCISDTWDR